MFASKLAALLLVGLTPRAAIQAQYDRWSKAYMALDVPVLESILAPDYRLLDSQGETTSREKYVAYLRLKAKLPSDGVKTRTEIRRFKMVAETQAEVIAIETMESRALNPKSRRLERCLHRHEYLDIWVSRDGEWLLRSTTTQKESTEFRKL